MTADGASAPERAMRLGPLRVLSPEEQEPHQRVDYRLGSAIRLTGYDVNLHTPDSPEASQTDSVEVTLYWRAVAAPERDFAVFVHLLDVDGQLLAQHDHAPRQDDYPTWAWQEGDRIPDSHTLPLPSQWQSGTYRLWVGLYQIDDGTRLPVLDGKGRRVPDDVVALTDVNLSDAR